MGMPLICDMNTLADLMQFVLWCAAVWTLATIVFRSFAAQEIQARLARRPKATERRRIVAELQSDVRARRSSKNLIRGLDEAEIVARRARLAELSKSSTLVRAVRYLMSCELCQYGWSAAALLMCASDWWGFGWFAVSVLAYMGVTFLAVSRIQAAKTPPAPASPRGGCGSARR